MTKLGDSYQELVGAVEKALDPGATVRVGVWVIGPDGRRDLDVEVRGAIDGKPTFVQIECKDWADPVGIAVVDALDSKRRDLGADRALMYSNSGFTEPALKKAARLGIGMASALKAGDKLVKVAIYEQVVAKALSVDRVAVTLRPPPGFDLSIPNDWRLESLAFNGRPVQNWLAPLTRKLLVEREPHGTVTIEYTFCPSTSWSYGGAAIEVAGMRVKLECRRAWVTQTVRPDVSLGMYDHIRKLIAIPSKQAYSSGIIDREGWKPFEGEPEPQTLGPNSFSLSLTLLNPLAPVDETPVADLDGIILEQVVHLGTTEQ